MYTYQILLHYFQHTTVQENGAVFLHVENFHNRGNCRGTFPRSLNITTIMEIFHMQKDVGEKRIFTKKVLTLLHNA